MTFLTDNFLLQSEAAARLYHDYAASMPIIDYHCHLPPKDVAEDRRFSNITEVWLAGDHYKWRAMRAAGVDEHYITGNASDWEKFEKWAETTPKTLRNPLYHWTHLELRRPFGITNRLLSPETAKSIWNDTNAKLQQQHFSARGIMRQMNVQLVCTTDDPADTLEHHQKIAADPNFGIKVLPTFRPDKAVNFLADDYHAYLDKLGAAAHLKIHTLDDLLVALYRRHDYFHEHGCRLSDHGFCRFFYKPVRQDIRTRSVRNLTAGDDWTDLQNAVLFHIAKWNAEKNWTMQLHIGAIRNNNSRMFVKLGADSGFDSIADHDGYAGHLGLFFDSLDVQGILPKTIVYNLNPSDNEMLCTMIGNFQTAETRMFPPKMQFGSGWWFLDQKEGIERQLNTLSNLGLLSGFVGMLTDSRSFLSYTRHEYFRRILCNLLGGEMEAGLLPGDFGMIGKLVQDICYNNAKNYFGF
ncbi:MAG: glucuronate isomerase [Planctomycetaceae bacterium]|jgi:glucuronate isomerase|nr:glucuronate isomerase [Planctomycetaceae bacterium]